MGSRGRGKRQKSRLGRKVRGLFERIPDVYRAVEVVNPNYGTRTKDHKWDWNCARCTVAGALQIMGYDVQAAPWDGKWYGFDTVFDFDWKNYGDYIAPSSHKVNWGGTDYIESFKNPNKAKQRTVALAKQIDDKMQEWGTNSFAALNVHWKNSDSAHAILVYREKDRTRLMDFQTGRVYSGREAIEKYLKRVEPSKTGLYRLDNKKIKRDQTDFDKVIIRS